MLELEEVIETINIKEKENIEVNNSHLPVLVRNEQKSSVLLKQLFAVKPSPGLSYLDFHLEKKLFSSLQCCGGTFFFR